MQRLVRMLAPQWLSTIIGPVTSQFPPDLNFHVISSNSSFGEHSVTALLLLLLEHASSFCCALKYKSTGGLPWLFYAVDPMLTLE